jgi:hypothetical protein
MTLAFLLVSALVAAGPSTGSALAANAQPRVQELPNALEFNRRLKLISLSVRLMPGDNANTNRLYEIMFEACETALLNNVSPGIVRPKEGWKGAFCSCDTITSIGEWLEDPGMSEKLQDFKMSPTYDKYTYLTDRHFVFRNNDYCRAGVQRDANAQP